MYKFNDPAGRLAALQATRLPTACLFTILLVLFLSIAGRLQALTVSEIMYHSSTPGGTGDEFIELYNENVDPIDLSGYSICNGINFVFPRGTYLDGHSYLVVCADEAAIRDRSGITNTIGDWVGSLDNSGERIEICNTGGRVVVEMRYNDRGKWPVGAHLDDAVASAAQTRHRAVGALNSLADALPALGIVAAVLGIIKTMSLIDQSPDVLGPMIATALLGTFLGVFLAYGLVGPLAARFGQVVDEEILYLETIRTVIDRKSVG